MSAQENQHLIKMANQIAANMNAGLNEEELADKVAEHMRKFWAGPMKAAIRDIASNQPDEISPAVHKALERM